MPTQPPHQLASAVVLDAAGRHVLLVKDPALPRWRLPVGHAEGGEAVAEAARRHVREQTGLGRVTVVQPHLGLQQDLVQCNGAAVRHIEHVFLLMCDPGLVVGPGPVAAGENREPTEDVESTTVGVKATGVDRGAESGGHGRGRTGGDIAWFAVGDLPDALLPGVVLHLSAGVRMLAGR